jgi:hypothetical protein
VAQLRKALPSTQLIIRGDSGFCRDELMSWCEATERVDFVFGLARNERLQKELSNPMEMARAAYERTGHAARRFRTFRYRTLKSWSRTVALWGRPST